MKKKIYKVMIVEDSQLSLEFLIHLLEPEYHIVSAQSGVEALKKVNSEYPDIILLDIVLPGIDGYDVIKELKKNEITNLIPVIFITSLTDEEDEVKGFSLGAVDYITKPFKESIVKARIAMHLKNVTQMRLNERLMLMLDTSPICSQLWDENLNKLDCNEAAVKLFKFKNKKDFLSCSSAIYPEYQPDGAKSLEIIQSSILQAFNDGGPIVLDWTYKLLDGTLLPAEVILIRVKHQGKSAIAVYTRDLREQVKMMEGIFAATNKLQAAMHEAQEAHRVKNNTLNVLEKILNSIDAAIYVTIPDTGEIIFVNDWLKKVNGIEGDAAIGLYCYKVFRRGFDAMCDFCPCRQLDKEPGKTIVWEEFIKETNLYVRHSDCYINWPDGRKVHLQYSVDITSLVDALEQAKHSNGTKAEFLSRMSHEMRTPLNAITGFTQILMADNLPVAMKESVVEISNASGQLLQMVEDVLDAADMEYGKFQLEDSVFGFRRLIGGIRQMISSQIAAKHHTFNAVIAPAIPEMLVGDEKRLRQIVGNLLSNAVKFTPDNGEISFTANIISENEEAIVLQIAVTDNGIGISEEALAKLFCMFEQLDESRAVEHSGIGLGLALSKRVAALMGGDITVESEPGKGAKFIFTFELKKE